MSKQKQEQKQVEEEQEYQEAVEEYKEIKETDNKNAWRKGDLAKFVETKWGEETLQKYAVRVGEEYNTLRQFKEVSEAFEFDERSSKLSWYHHLIAKATDNPEEWLKKAEENNWSGRELIFAIKKSNELIRVPDIGPVSAFDNNMFYFLKEKDNSEKFLEMLEEAKQKKMKLYNGARLELFNMNEIPCLTRVGEMFHEDGKEFTLREYARVQDFPENFKFVGTKQEIKNQIGEAVSPLMAEYIINKYIKKENEKYVELFCGAGGFSVGADKLIKQCKYAVDFNRYSIHSFSLNFPFAKTDFKDITKLDAKKIHKEVGDVDFIIGGPPCQGFSSVGKQLGFKEDSRNQLYLDYLRFVKEFKPKQFIMENVKEILEHKDEIIKDFEKIGYDVTTEKVNGLDIGMRQKRIRAFFIGNRK